MGALHNVQYEQLRMFMPASEVYNNYPTVDNERPDRVSREENEETMEWKLDEAQYETPQLESLYDNVTRRGVERPVRLYQGYRGTQDRPSWAKGVLGNGGHRTAVMNDSRPDDLIPVLHAESFLGERESVRDNEDYSAWGTRHVNDLHGGWR